jgi:hypothetical protein
MAPSTGAKEGKGDRVKLSDWLERCERLARELDGLGVRFSITISVVPVGTIAAFESAATPVQAAPPPVLDRKEGGAILADTRA